MPEFPETSESLLARVRDPANHVAWEQFEQLYRPVIFRIARSRGLQHCDALDLVQQVLISVASAIEDFEPYGEGIRFRNWLARITRNAILKAGTRGRKFQGIGGTDILAAFQDIPDSESVTDALIELEYRRELYVRAAQQVRGEVQESTWLAFERTVLEGLSPESTASSLGLSIGSVYAARSRIMRRLRDAVQKIENTVAFPVIGEQS